MPAAAPSSDAEFVDSLRSAVDAYLSAVDAWEAEFRRFYRMPGVPVGSHPELARELREVGVRRRALEALFPRARRLCLKHQVRESFSALLRINLGRYAPQERSDSAIARSERNAVTESLIELKTATQTWLESPGEPGGEPAPSNGPQKGSLLKRLVDFFY
jgi:hypothetical protein